MATATSSNNPLSRITNIIFLARRASKMKRQTPESWADTMEYIAEELKPKLRYLGLKELQVILKEVNESYGFGIDINALDTPPNDNAITLLRKRVVSVGSHQMQYFFLSEDGEWVIIQFVRMGRPQGLVMTHERWVDVFENLKLNLPGSSLVRNVVQVLFDAEKAADSRHKKIQELLFWGKMLLKDVEGLPFR